MPIDRDLHRRTAINLAIKAFQGSADYVGSMLFPQVPVGKQSDKYSTVSKNQVAAGADDVARQEDGGAPHRVRRVER